MSNPLKVPLECMSSIIESYMKEEATKEEKFL